eukprot:5051041-Lingulodinium_polyedra.AAC.1
MAKSSAWSVANQVSLVASATRMAKRGLTPQSSRGLPPAAARLRSVSTGRDRRAQMLAMASSDS